MTDDALVMLNMGLNVFDYVHLQKQTYFPWAPPGYFAQGSRSKFAYRFILNHLRILLWTVVRYFKVSYLYCIIKYNKCCSWSSQHLFIENKVMFSAVKGYPSLGLNYKIQKGFFTTVIRSEISASTVEIYMWCKNI